MGLVARFVIFVISLFLGIGAVKAVSSIDILPTIPDIAIYEPANSKPRPSIAPSGVLISYVGLIPDEDDANSYLKFVIYNGSHQAVTYGAYSSLYPFPELKVNGRQLEEPWRCAMGIEAYAIQPRQSAIVHVPQSEFLVRVKKGESVSVGFYLSEANPADALNFDGVHWSEPFQLPEDFRRSIGKSEMR